MDTGNGCAKLLTYKGWLKMAHDVLGNAISGQTAEFLDGVNDFVSGFLAYQTRAINILAAAEAAPEAMLANVYAGWVAMFADTREAPVTARRWLDRARLHYDRATRREQMNFSMLEAWISYDIPRALAIGDDIVSDYPTDLAALKLHQTFNFNLGNAPEMLRIAQKAMSANQDNPHLYGMLAFGFEQCHELGKAEEAANRALDITFAEPWAHHALAHVMLTQGRVPEGRNFMRRASETWIGLNSFMYTHNWWHAALFDISAGDFETVLKAYDTHCWGIDKAYSQDQIGAVSLLARMELAGMEVGARWSDLGQHLRVRAQDTLQPFLTIQYLYGLAKAGLPEADDLMRAVEERAASAQAFEKTAWADVALPACRGLLAHARGRHAEAVRELTAAMPHMMQVGGSHAQRDLFAQVLLDAHVQNGDLQTARQMLERRRKYDPNGIPLNRMLAQIYEKLGLLDEAADAASRRYA